jgi:hypothetical protein
MRVLIGTDESDVIVDMFRNPSSLKRVWDCGLRRLGVIGDLLMCEMSFFVKLIWNYRASCSEMMSDVCRKCFVKDNGEFWLPLFFE